MDCVARASSLGDDAFKFPVYPDTKLCFGGSLCVEYFQPAVVQHIAPRHTQIPHSDKYTPDNVPSPSFQRRLHTTYSGTSDTPPEDTERI